MSYDINYDFVDNKTDLYVCTMKEVKEKYENVLLSLISQQAFQVFLFIKQLRLISLFFFFFKWNNPPSISGVTSSLLHGSIRLLITVMQFIYFSLCLALRYCWEFSWSSSTGSCISPPCRERHVRSIMTSFDGWWPWFTLHMSSCNYVVWQLRLIGTVWSGVFHFVWSSFSSSQDSFLKCTTVKMCEWHFKSKCLITSYKKDTFFDHRATSAVFLLYSSYVN